MAAYDQTRADAVKVIESLRSGVPTRVSTQEMPDLRPELTNTIRHDLESFAAGTIPPGRLIWGQYGEGKSHVLKVVEHIALGMDFAVSFVSMSREVSCHSLFHFYRRVAPILRTAQSQVPGLQKQLLAKKPSELGATPIPDPTRYMHPLPAIVLELLLHSQGDEDSYDLYNDLMGDRLPVAEVRRAAQDVGLAARMRNLPRFKLEHGSAYFGVLADAIRFCGYRGWIVLIDEVELVSRLGKVSRLSAYKNLNWLLNWSGEMHYPIYTLGASTPGLQTLLWHDERRGRPKDTVAITELARVRFGDEAEKQMREFFETASGERCPRLAAVDREALLPLLERIVQLHGRALAWDPPAPGPWVREVTSSLPSGTKLRTYIRLLVEALDQLLLTGQAPELVPLALPEPATEEEEGFFRSDSTSGM